MPDRRARRDADEPLSESEMAHLVAALDDELIAGTERPDIVEVDRNLQAASQQRHLTAFRRCAERSGGTSAPASGPAGGGRHRARRRRRGG